ncbi:DUF2255 family protein [Fulvivirga kasyanovii]|uniref:DUF2255 family protein n=1 Tax=Fulvivirga kasyanovii TaxID=396812 RepID=A0ABW9RWV4_9BACT|nr:DUF2255 family protein [Fulvivirga kasyanovii]MTI28734.1 DUF2255 family protein [Fulvivirga kasyanovii]
MDNISKTLTQEEIAQIALKDDFHIAPYRADGKTFGTPTWIWVVMVEGELYVRAYNGTGSRWYKSAIDQGAGKIEAAGLVKSVRFKPVSGKINEKIDEAYRRKYNGSPYLNAMISERTKAATIQILPGVE